LPEDRCGVISRLSGCVWYQYTAALKYYKNNSAVQADEKTAAMTNRLDG